MNNYCYKYNKTMSICKWIRNDNTQCVLESIKNKNYCKLHSKFENLYNPDELHNLKRCKKCKKVSSMLHPNNYCDNCMINQKKQKDKRKSGVKCKWLNQKGNPCSWCAIKNTNFCKVHSKYENITTEINNLSKCSGCKNMFESKNGYKTCENCLELNKKKSIIIKENKIICQAIVKRTKKRCSNKCLPNDNYCGLHQTYKIYKELTKDNKKVCSNWERGCLNILNDDDKSKCKLCKLLELDKTKNVNDIFNERFNLYKNEAKRRNISFNIEKENFINLIKGNCFYCNYFNGLNGLDRLNSSEGYSNENCVSCCSTCNIMKNNKSYDEFIGVIIHLYNFYVNNKIDISYYKKNYKLYFTKKKTTTSYNIYKGDSINRKIEFKITEEEYKALINSGCYYCKLFNETGSKGIDRINPNIGYINTNCVPCCKTCNMMKTTLSESIFKLKINNIYENIINNNKPEYDDYKTKLLILLSNHNIKININNVIDSNLKLIKEPSYYIDKIFDGDINDVNNFNIKLHFINYEDKLYYNVWQFYRKYISSFKKKNCSKLYGKNIYILVEDINTSKYLGIISLSSDIKNLKERDNYIGWNNKEYLTNGKINNILNISTCVSTQPFGYNYNGGKLLTSLCFTKEVLQYIYNKYNIYIQGFTTLSLYGKSVQYSRIPYIKFVGYTKGYSVKEISTEINEFCKNYLKNNNFEVNKDMLWNIQKTLKELNIPADEFLSSNQKGIYFGYTTKDSKKYLNNKIDEAPNPIIDAPTINEVYKCWLDKWAIKRYNHLSNTNRLMNKDEVKNNYYSQHQ